MVFSDRILLAGDETAFYKKGAQLYLEAAASAVRERGRFVVALSGGSTPKKLFSLLADPYYRDRAPWRETFFFWVDERCVPPNHADSNYKMTNDALLSKVSVPPDHIFRMQGEMDPREGAKAYESNLKSFFKVDRSLPQFDLMLLGVGEDGHTASLFPGTQALAEQVRWVVANYVDKLSSHRITLTLPVIEHTRALLFMVGGNAKAGIMKEILRDDLPQNRYPAQLVRPKSGELTWLLDKEAASKLPAAVHNRAQHV